MAPRAASPAAAAVPPRSPPALAPETCDSVVKNRQIKTALRADHTYVSNRLKQPRESLGTPRVIFLGFFGLSLQISSYKYILSILGRFHKHFVEEVADHIAKDEAFKNDDADPARDCHGAGATSLPRGSGRRSSREGSAVTGLATRQLRHDCVSETSPCVR